MTIREKIQVAEKLINYFKSVNKQLYILSKRCLYSFLEVEKNPLAESEIWHKETAELFIALIALV